MKKVVLLFICSILILGCSSNSHKFHRVVKTEAVNDANRLPSSELNSFDLTSSQLLKMKPVEIVEYLKNDCCDTRLIETTEIKNLWTEEDILELKKYMDDESPSSSVVKSTSSVHCKGERFRSSVKREAMHLLMALEKGFYPVSQCSTYDLRLKNTQPKN